MKTIQHFEIGWVAVTLRHLDHCRRRKVFAGK